MLGSLPDVTITMGDAITLQRRANTNGYYLHDAFSERTGAGTHCSEIALNPANFAPSPMGDTGSDAEILRQRSRP